MDKLIEALNRSRTIGKMTRRQRFNRRRVIVYHLGQLN